MKNSKLHIPISTERKDKLKVLAEKSGLSLASFCCLILSKISENSIKVKIEP